MSELGRARIELKESYERAWNNYFLWAACEREVKVLRARVKELEEANKTLRARLDKFLIEVSPC